MQKPSKATESKPGKGSWRAVREDSEVIGPRVVVKDLRKRGEGCPRAISSQRHVENVSVGEGLSFEVLLWQRR